MDWKLELQQTHSGKNARSFAQESFENENASGIAQMKTYINAIYTPLTSF
jgi:hypothetical protein